MQLHSLAVHSSRIHGEISHGQKISAVADAAVVSADTGSIRHEVIPYFSIDAKQPTLCRSTEKLAVQTARASDYS